MAITYITLAGVVVAVVGLALSLTKLNAIHVLVNSRLTSVINRVAQLVDVLKFHGIDVPDDPDPKERHDPNLSIASLFVLVPELFAVFTNAGNSLSEYAWRKLHVGLSFSPNGVHTLAWWLSLIAWGFFVVIMTAHIWWRAT
jgi:hypothetical protein